MKNTNCLTFRNLKQFSISNGVSTATVAYDPTNQDYVLCWDWGMHEGVVRDDNYVHYIPKDRWNEFKEALNVEYPEANYLYLSTDTKSFLQGYASVIEHGRCEENVMFSHHRSLFEQGDHQMFLLDREEFMR